MGLCAIIIVFLLAVSAATLPPPRTGPVKFAPSATQVSVDGVPVCVFSHAGQIIASVGRCGIEVAVPEPGQAGERVTPGQHLPPGHPPIEDQGLGEPERLIPI